MVKRTCTLSPFPLKFSDWDTGSGFGLSLKKMGFGIGIPDRVGKIWDSGLSFEKFGFRIKRKSFRGRDGIGIPNANS